MRSIGGLLVAISLQLLPPTPASAQHVGLRPWDAPDGLTAGWTEPAVHSNDASVALSPEGDFLAATSMVRASSEISVVDLKSRSGWRLVTPDWRLDLFDQSFSPDGQRLAFVVSAPHSNRGVTEIWIAPRTGGVVSQRIGAPGRAYRHPTFSPDGRRLAYFRDVEPETPSGEIFPEFVLKRAFALFEYDLATGVETQLADQAYGYGCGLEYQPEDKGVFFCAFDPQEWRALAPGLPEQWYGRRSAPGEETDLQYDERINYSRVFYLPHGAQIPRWPDPVAPREPGIKAYALIGVRLDGAVLLMSHGPEPFPIEFPMVERYTAFTPGQPPETVEVSVSVFGCSKRAASADGRVFAFEGDCTSEKRRGEYKPKPSSFFVTRDGVLERLAPKDVSFEREVRVLTPPAGSYFARTPPRPYAFPSR